MAEYDDDEFNGATRWLQKNAGPAVAGVVIGIVLLAGWYGWSWYGARQDSHAGELYAQAQSGINNGQVTGGVVNVVDTLQNDYAGTPYAGAAAMALGAYYVDQKQYGKAAKRLDWARQQADSAGMRAIATVRYARVQWAAGQADQALQTLDAKHPPAFDSLYGELIGDIQMAQGHASKAHAAYQQAIKALPENAPRQALAAKLSASAPADDAAASQSNNATDKS